MSDSTPASKGENDGEDAVKRKFREALERKQAQAKAGAAHEDHGSKVAPPTGPLAGKRTFRRKTGG